MSAELVAAGRTSRVPAALLLVATLVGAPLAGAILGNIVDPGLGALVGVVGFVSLLAFVIVTIARSSSALRRLSPAASQGDVASVLPPARSTLRWVFRGDLRSGALCALALAAEARGDVSAAAELFARAERAPSARCPRACLRDRRAVSERCSRRTSRSRLRRSVASTRRGRRSVARTPRSGSSPRSSTGSTASATSSGCSTGWNLAATPALSPSSPG